MGEVVKTVKTPAANRENNAAKIQKSEFSQSISSPIGQILFLQRTIGNQAVQRLMKSGALQAKLRIGAPGDIYEQEADRVAELVHAVQQDGSNNESVFTIQRQSNTQSGAANMSYPPVAINSARLRRLEELLNQISTQTAAHMELRAELDRLPAASSEERTLLENDLNNGRLVLIDLLLQRIALLNEEVDSLNARIGPSPVSSPEHPEIEALGYELLHRERERHQHEEQLRPLKRWQMRQEIGSINDQIAEIDRELANLPPVSDPSDPTAELLLLRRFDLEQRKRQLVRTLASSATEYKQFDPRWGAVRYGQSPACTNIQAAGCGPTSLAILLNYLYHEDPESLAATGEMEIVTPSQTASYAATHGRVCNSGTVGDTMVTNVHTGWPGFQGRRISLGEATTQIRNGNLVIFLCKGCTGQKRGGGNKSYGGHFMVLSGVNDDATVYNVLDPGAGETTDIETISKTELQNHSAGFWIVNRM